MPEDTEQPIKCGCAVPNTNAMIFEQIDGCCKSIRELFLKLRPIDNNVVDCMMTFQAWQNNNLKHLKGAFE